MRKIKEEVGRISSSVVRVSISSRLPLVGPYGNVSEQVTKKLEYRNKNRGGVVRLPVMGTDVRGPFLGGFSPVIYCLSCSPSCP